ncbi:MAG TPA: chloride channel protein [Gaiellaceae bacterium]|jgi:H+/Cl- antiporter ClcA|nr:chloride channel protein [Gaiellaceae bacterium]
MSSDESAAQATARPDAGPSGPEYLRLVGFAALIGIPAAVVAALFLAFVHDGQHWLWADLPARLGHSSPPWYLVIGLPVVGAAIVVAARLLLPGDGGHSPINGIDASPTPFSHGPGVAVAATGTLMFGAVLGPEGPLIALGSVTAMAFAPLMRLTKRQSGGLALAGSFSAISALFGGPIVGGVMMVEASAPMLGATLIPVLLPGFVAAALGYTIFIGFGNWGGLGVPGLEVPGLPAYHGTHIRDLIVAVFVGVIAAAIIAPIRRLARRISDDRRLGLPVLLLGGGLAVGALAEAADLLGASSQDVLFSGQSSVPALISPESTKILVILIVAKGIAYAVSLGCGFRGGPVFPAIFLGVAVATFAVDWFHMSPTVAVAAGAAAGMCASTRLVLTSILFGALLVGLVGLDAVPAVVLAAAAAWLTMSILEPVHPPADPEPHPG